MAGTMAFVSFPANVVLASFGMEGAASTVALVASCSVTTGGV